MIFDGDMSPLVRFALGAVTNQWQEVGSKELDTFKLVAADSNVPMNFNDARTKVMNELQERGYDDPDKLDLEVGYRLFEGTFDQPKRILYACNYGVAVGTTKFLLKTEKDTKGIVEQANSIRQLIDDIRGRLAASYMTTPDDIARWDEEGQLHMGLGFTFLHDLRRVIDLINGQSNAATTSQNALAQSQRISETTLGMVLMDEARLKEKDAITLKTPLEYAKKQREVLAGTYFGFNEAMRTRESVEHYFSDPQKVARIHFLR